MQIGINNLRGQLAKNPNNNVNNPPNRIFWKIISTHRNKDLPSIAPESSAGLVQHRWPQAQSSSHAKPRHRNREMHKILVGNTWMLDGVGASFWLNRFTVCLYVFFYRIIYSLYDYNYMLWNIDMIVLFWLVLGMLPPWDRFQLPFTILFMGFDRAEHCWSKFILFVKPNIANMNQEIWKSTVDFRRVLAVKIIINHVHLKTQMQQWTRRIGKNGKMLRKFDYN